MYAGSKAMLSRIEVVAWGLVVVLVLFRAAVVVATGKTAMVVMDPVSWDRSLKFWDH
jgi:hypothetical protein